MLCFDDVSADHLAHNAKYVKRSYQRNTDDFTMFNS